jgi:hypothetical protein
VIFDGGIGDGILDYQLFCVAMSLDIPYILLQNIPHHILDLRKSRSINIVPTETVLMPPVSLKLISVDADLVVSSLDAMAQGNVSSDMEGPDSLKLSIE